MAAFSARALSDSETQRVHAVSLRVLVELGVDVCHETIRARLLHGCGGRSDELPRALSRRHGGRGAGALPGRDRVGFRQDPNTLRFLRSGEHFYAGSFETSGSPKSARTMVENLHTRVEQILARHKPIVPESRVEDLRRYVEANR